MVESRTVIIQKDPTKGNTVGNYRLIPCFNLLWKLLSVIIRDTYQKVVGEEVS